MLNEEYRKKKWDLKTKIVGEIFENIDFTQTDFNHPIFDSVTFKNCLFDKSNFYDARLYRCKFINCTFKKVKLATVTIGAHGGLYENCSFEQCNFRAASFYYPEFIRCTFNKCQWKGVDLKASSFDSCKFIGKLEDVTFRGCFKSDLTEGAKPNLMMNVDFSLAILGDFVGFSGCDLSTAIPPVGYTFEQLLKPSRYGNDPSYIGTDEDGMLTE